MSAPAMAAVSSVPRRGEAARLARAARYRPSALLWALLLMHVTHAWRLPGMVPAIKPLHLGVTSEVLAVTLFVLDRRPDRRLGAVPGTPVRLAVLLLGAMVLATPAGLYPAQSVLFLMRNLVPALLLMLMLAAAVRTIADIEWFATANLVAAVAYGVFVLRGFQVDRDNRLEELLFYDGNDLALLLVATLPMVGYFLTRGHGVRRRLLALLCMPLFLVLLVRTGSRGGFLGLLMVASYLALNYRGVRLATRTAVIAVFGVSLLVFGGTAYFAKLETLLHPTQDYNWQGRSPTGRLEIWQRGIGYFAERPLLGVGPNNFARAEGRMSEIGQERQRRGESFKWSVAHNSYLETAVESGAVGLVAFVGLFVTAFGLLRRVVTATSELPFISRELLFAQALTAALIGFVVCSFFISAEYFIYPYTLLGLAIGLAKVTLAPSATQAVGRGST